MVNTEDEFTRKVRELAGSVDLRQSAASLAHSLLHPEATQLDVSLDELMGRLLPGALATSELRPASWQLAVELFEQRLLEQGDDAFLLTIATWIDSNGVTKSEAVRLANRLAWASRGVSTEIPEVLLPDRDRELVGTLFLLAMILERRRMLFQASLLLATLDQLDDDDYDFRSHPYVKSMYALALLSLGDRAQVPQAMALIHSAWHDEDYFEIAFAIRDVCLQAIWLGNQIEHQGDTLLKYCDEYSRDAHLLRYNALDPVPQYRRACALRMLGRYSEAIEALDGAFSALKGSNEFTRTFSEQCQREREFILFTENLQKLREGFEEVGVGVRRSEARVEESERRVEQLEHEGALRSTQAISIFTAAVAFAVGSASIGANAKTTLSAIIAAGGLAVGLLGFTWLLIYLTRGPLEMLAGKRNKALVWTTLALSIGASVLAITAIGVSLAR